LGYSSRHNTISTTGLAPALARHSNLFVYDAL
jgi:hypothetical protein